MSKLGSIEAPVQPPGAPKPRGFTMQTPEYDESTYQGRFESFRAMTNPFNSFLSNDTIQKERTILERQKQREQAQFEQTGSYEVSMQDDEIRKVRRAQAIVATAIHPDTKELISWPFRFSSFLPMNIPIAFGFVFVAPTPFNTIFFQWLNQTYNAGLNYANRNASSQYTTKDLALSYGIATSAAIGVGLGIRKALSAQLASSSGARLIFLNASTSFCAVASAGFLNAFVMRLSEIKNGIDVLDKDTLEPVGKSQVVAKKAVFQTALSRIFLVTTIFLPPLVLVGLEKAHMLPKGTPQKSALEFSLLFLQLYFAVPIGLAMFPRLGSITAIELEPKFQGLKAKDGSEITEFVFNKGL